jgi:hypothetical protein
MLEGFEGANGEKGKNDTRFPLKGFVPMLQPPKAGKLLIRSE